MVRRLAVCLLVVMAACSDDKGGDVDVSADETTTTTEAPTTTTSTTAAPATTTTAPPAPTTTAKPTTTTTTIPASMARVTIVNHYSAAMVVKINGGTYNVAAGGRKGPFGVKPGATDGNDIITLYRADDPTCGTGSPGSYFTAGGTFEVTLIVSAPSGCNGGKQSPGGRVNPGNQGI